MTERMNNMLNNRSYDILKYIALIALPAIQVFWLTIGKIWDINYTIEIGATIGACALLLGTLLGVSNANYNKMLDEYQDLDIDYSEGEGEEDSDESE